MREQAAEETGRRAQEMRARLARGETIFGVFCKSTSPEWIECLGRAGFDFCILDREHGPAGFETVQGLVLAAERSGMLPIVRVANAQEGEIEHSLDIGSGGIQVPQVASVETARRIVDAAKFAPIGHRGVCRFVRAAGYSSLPREAYFEEANKALVILQLEDTDLEEYRKMAELPGVDILFIGPYDLSQRLGLTGQVDHPRVLEEIRQMIDLARSKGRVVGIFADTMEQAERWIKAGCQYIAYSVDVGIFMDACAKIRRALAEKGNA